MPKGPLRSGDVARIAHVSTDILRHYERKGLLAPRRSANGYREYPAETLERVQMIRRALAVGFTLDELSSILASRDRGGVPCREVRALAAAKLEAMEAQMRELAELRDDLRALLLEWDKQLAETPAGGQARLLEAMGANKQANADTPMALSQRWHRQTRDSERMKESEEP